MQLEYRKVWKQILKQNYQDCLDSPIRDSLNIGLLEIEENGKLEKMRQKWWQRGGETQCQVNSSSSLQLEAMIDST